MAVLGQNWEENKYLRHQNISAPLDGMYGSKAVNKTLLGVSSKIDEATSKKGARIVSTPRVLIVTQNLEGLKSAFKKKSKTKND